MVRRRKWRAFGVGISLGLLAIAAVLLRPHGLVRAIARLSPDVVFFIETERRAIALTIDDAPDPATTPDILDVLNAHNARATFFVMGEAAQAHPHLVERMLAEGHELGNHTMRDEPSIRLSPDALRQTMDRTHDILSAFGDVNWFRPASGWYSGRMLDMARDRSYQTVLGSIFPFDTHVSSSGFATWYVVANARPGAIVVLHDGGDRGRRTAVTLSQVLPELSDRGYEITSLSNASRAQAPRPDGRESRRF
ncbi:MAG: polysaccharide deacetylase family protein [Cyanobacteria bacterium J06639_1]